MITNAADRTTGPPRLLAVGPALDGSSYARVVESTLEPLSAALFAWWWLHQRLDGWQIAGAALVIAAVAVVQSEQQAAAPTPAPLE